MTTERKIIELLKNAYKWGIDYGSNRSDKNFNDFLQTSGVKEYFSALEKELAEEDKAFVNPLKKYYDYRHGRGKE